MSSEKQLVCADWQLIAPWFNLVRDFQKCCVHSDVEIGVPRSLCVQNFNAPKKGDKGPPRWCHSTVSKQALVGGEGPGQDILWPSLPHTLQRVPSASPWSPLIQRSRLISELVGQIFMTFSNLNLPTQIPVNDAYMSCFFCYVSLQQASSHVQFQSVSWQRSCLFGYVPWTPIFIRPAQNWQPLPHIVQLMLCNIAYINMYSQVQKYLDSDRYFMNLLVLHHHRGFLMKLSRWGQSGAFQL